MSKVFLQCFALEIKGTIFAFINRLNFQQCLRLTYNTYFSREIVFVCGFLVKREILFPKRYFVFVPAKMTLLNFSTCGLVNIVSLTCGLVSMRKFSGWTAKRFQGSSFTAARVYIYRSEKLLFPVLKLRTTFAKCAVVGNSWRFKATIKFLDLCLPNITCVWIVWRKTKRKKAQWAQSNMVEEYRSKEITFLFGITMAILKTLRFQHVCYAY